MRCQKCQSDMETEWDEDAQAVLCTCPNCDFSAFLREPSKEWKIKNKGIIAENYQGVWVIYKKRG